MSEIRFRYVVTTKSRFDAAMRFGSKTMPVWSHSYSAYGGNWAYVCWNDVSMCWCLESGAKRPASWASKEAAMESRAARVITLMSQRRCDSDPDPENTLVILPLGPSGIQLWHSAREHTNKLMDVARCLAGCNGAPPTPELTRSMIEQAQNLPADIHNAALNYKV